MYRVVITMETHGYDYGMIREYLKQHGYLVDWRPVETKKPVEVLENITGYDAVIAGGDCMNRDVLMKLADTVKIIARYGIGVDTIDIDSATELGIAVTNTPGKMSAGVAETALVLMIAAARRLCVFDRKIRAGEWYQMYVGTQLEDKTVGLIGFGQISQKLARYLQGFSCEVLAYDQYFDEAAARELSVKKSNLEEIAGKSDFVSIHLPLTDETSGMIAKEFFTKMKPTAYLINTSRGAILREADLIMALQQKKIAGAGLDVFEQEPVAANNPLLTMDNVVLTPHIASTTMEAVENVGKCAADNIIAYFEGRVPPNILNPNYVKNLR
jgi:D-3-phosphoglycerate dehydrogenase